MVPLRHVLNHRCRRYHRRTVSAVGHLTKVDLVKTAARTNGAVMLLANGKGVVVPRPSFLLIKRIFQEQKRLCDRMERERSP